MYLVCMACGHLVVWGTPLTARNYFPEKGVIVSALWVTVVLGLKSIFGDKLGYHAQELHLTGLGVGLCLMSYSH